MRAIATALPGVLILEPKVFGDARGFFLESYNRKTFAEATGVDVEFVQDNHSRSAKGVLRGLHLQAAPHAQGKLVRVAAGRVFDVVADVRRASPTFSRWVGVELDAESQRQLWIPAGYAHGFLVLSESADFLYKTTDYYAPAHELSVRWDDPRLGIEWPDIGMPFALAARDRDAPLLDERPRIE
jgi:dTDP-4-dehydrorhamnose 3,5-epimerase